MLHFGRYAQTSPTKEGRRFHELTYADISSPQASDYFGIKLHMIPVDEKTRKIRLDLVKRAM